MAKSKSSKSPVRLKSDPKTVLIFHYKTMSPGIHVPEMSDVVFGIDRKMIHGVGTVKRFSDIKF